MEWSDLKGIIGSAAPILGTLIGGPAGAAVGSIVASALGTGNTPDEVHAALAASPDAAVKLRQIESDQSVRLRDLAVTAENNRLIADTAQVATVNQTMQVEDKTRAFSWRDFWGYVSGVGFGFTVLTVMYMIAMAIYTGHYESLDKIPAIVGSFSVLFAIAAGVLGVQSGIETHHSGMVDRINAQAGLTDASQTK